MLSNPYSSIPHPERIKIQARVSPEDLQLLQRLIPYRDGLQDHVLSTLFHAFITELRHLDSGGLEPLPSGWHPASPTYILVEELLGRCNFRREEQDLSGTLPGPPSGLSGRPGGPSPSDVPGGSGSVCPEVQRPPRERANPKSRIEPGSD